MKILSINVSKPRIIQYGGKDVLTGIFKQAVSAEVFIGKLNLQGDEQADLKNHGGEHKAVYAFSASHYEYWRNALGEPELPFGSFGENFTVSNFSEERIRIGDEFQFGSAVLQVSQPRIPCFKLGIALNNKSAPKLFIKTYSTGIYFRVLTPGSVKTGDSIHLSKKSLHSITVKKVFQAYFDNKYSNAEMVLAEAIGLDELAPEWKEKIAKKLGWISPASD